MVFDRSGIELLNHPVMKSYLSYIILFLCSISMSSCELVGDIFKGGVWTGAILVIGVIVAIIWVVAKAFGGGGK
jgi:hypothetical protein